MQRSSINLHDKLRAYRRNGVKEYLTWRTLEAQFDWRVFAAGEFRLLKPEAKGILRSTVFPGLWLPVKGLLKGDGAAVLAGLDAGLRSPEHKSFVARLAGGLRPKS